MKLYTVTLETEVVVVAEDEEGAERAAADALSEMGSYDLCFSAQPLRFLPIGWDGKELPFPDPDLEIPEMDINGWIDAGAAPELTARMAKRARDTKRPAGDR